MSDAPAVLSWTIGDVVVHRVEERVVAVPVEQLLPDATLEAIASVGDWLDPFFTDDGRMQLSLHSFVVVANGLTVVVDTCAGIDPERPLRGSAEFPERLAAAIDGGFDAVDIVLCTHLHFDHVGWNTTVRNGERVPTFPNARYLFGRVEVDHTRGDDHMGVIDPAVEPLIEAGLVDLVETDHRIGESIRLIPTTGHTPGHVSVILESNGERGLITGDAFHSPIQIARPDIAAVRFDWDSAASTATRQALIERTSRDGTLVLGTHFAPPTAGRIETGDDYARFVW